MRINWGMLVLVTALVGCGDDDDFGDDQEMSADLDGRPGFTQLDGDATVRWTEGTSGFIATIDLEGDEPGQIRPWHVHYGTCGSGGDIVGSDEDYPRLEIDDNGQGLATATVAEQLVSGDLYHVNVHLSEEDMDTIIACGDLEDDDFPVDF